MVSIIVPNYNHRKFLSQRLDTIFNQTFQDFEVILLDDCSTDESWEYLSRFANHPQVSHCIRNESNSGSPFKQWKKGIELAKYEWIWIAESDDYSSLKFLENVVTGFKPNVIFSFCSSFCVNHNGVIWDSDKDLWWNQEELQMIGDSLWNGNHFVRKNLLVRNSIMNASSVVFRKPSEFPNEIALMKYSGDWFFWIFLSMRGNISFVNQRLNFFRFHSSTSRVKSSFDLELIRFKEVFKCVEFARKFSKTSLFSLSFQRNMALGIRVFFKISLKKGRSRFYVLFPNIPLHFYFLYYYYFLKSFIKKG